MLKPSTQKYIEISNINIEDINKMSYDEIYNFATSERMLYDLIVNCSNIELMRKYLLNHRTY
ncbi:MAG: hypothetical protein MSA15_20505 [Clostridium sp.]|nr:hypothetical protein [Clostridium sp.]